MSVLNPIYIPSRRIPILADTETSAEKPQRLLPQPGTAEKVEEIVRDAFHNPTVSRRSPDTLST
jgi:hypothetical protein